MRRRPGFTLLESLFALTVVVAALLILLSVFTLSRRQGDENRARLLAQYLVQNLVAEVLAHRWGTPKPADWEEVRVREMLVEGRRLQLQLSPKVEVAPGGDGSLFGQARNNRDVVRVSVTWRDPRDRQVQDLAAVVTVRRENGYDLPLPR